MARSPSSTPRPGTEQPGTPGPVTPRRSGRRRSGRRVLRVSVALAALVTSGALYVMQPVLAGDAVPPATRVRAARLREHVDLLAGAMAPRTERVPENLDRAAAYIRAQWQAAGLDASLESFEVAGQTFSNVVAHAGPESGERIIVGAHYDAAGPGIGADDNASGVAGLLELAPRIAAAGLPLRVDFVAYTLEEPPYFGTPWMGSRMHAEACRAAGVKVRAMLCLEMIGCFSDAPDSQSYPVPALRLLYPSRGDFITVVGCVGQAGLVRQVKRAMQESAALPVWSINAPRSLPGIDFSDHASYWDAGYDAVMVSDTAFYRNEHYHERTDTADRLDYDRMALVVEGVCGAVEALSR